jgi:hypothetical protein
MALLVLSVATLVLAVMLVTVVLVGMQALVVWVVLPD